MNEQVQAGYVLTDTGDIYVQLPSGGGMAFPFFLASDDQAFTPAPSGVRSWELLSDDDPRISAEDRERLSWLLEDYR